MSRPVGNAGGIKMLGVAIRRNLIQKGYIDLKGRSAGTPEEVAAISQIIRSLQVETFRIIHTQNGKVVGQEDVSSRMPGSSCRVSTLFPTPSPDLSPTFSVLDNKTLPAGMPTL